MIEEEPERISEFKSITKLFSLSILIIFVIIIYSLKSNLSNIPEIQFYDNQTLKLLMPSKQCKFPNHKTLFFTSNLRNN